MDKIAVVTGANRGLGFETCRQLAQKGFQVILTSRDQGKGEVAAEQLRQQGCNVIAHQLDITDSASVTELSDFLRQRFNRLDVLINNAGIDLDRQDTNSILKTKIATLQQTMDTNVYGALRLCQALVPLMAANNGGHIINVSSGLGQISQMQSGNPAYRISKASLNALTGILAHELRGSHIQVNSVCPGWIQTDLGGANAPRSVAQGADTIVWLATKPHTANQKNILSAQLAKLLRKLSQAFPDQATNAGFFRDRKPIPW